MLGTQLHLNWCSSQLHETVMPIENEQEPVHLTYPRCGGLWTSTWNPDEYTSMWVEYLRQRSERVKPESCSWWLLTPDPHARILTIASQRDIDQLYTCYRLRNGSVHYEAMAISYDALHLTREAIQTVRASTFVQEWDVESTLWFHWKFMEVKKIEVPVLIGA